MGKERTIERELYRDDKERRRDRSSTRGSEKEKEEEKEKDGRKRIKRRNPEEIKKDIEQEKRVKHILAYASGGTKEETQKIFFCWNGTEMDLGNRNEERKQFEYLHISF